MSDAQPTASMRAVPYDTPHEVNHGLLGPHG